jgi:hypothetical protein
LEDVAYGYRKVALDAARRAPHNLSDPLGPAETRLRASDW